MRVLSIVLTVLLLAAVCPPLYSQKGKISDDQIYDQVKRRLASDRDVRGGAIEVDVKDGVVTLRGKVREEKQKRRAERVTRRVRGVTGVVNQLTVEPY